MKIYKISEIKEPQVEQTISCPFCKEDDFDLSGLKGHLLNGDCEIFNNVEKTIKRF